MIDWPDITPAEWERRRLAKVPAREYHSPALSKWKRTSQAARMAVWNLRNRRKGICP